MRRAALALAAVGLAAACGGGDDAVGADQVARLAGEVCTVPLLAGAVVVDDGLVLTAAHVVAGAAGPVTVRLGTGAEEAGTIVGFDPARDLAALAVPAGFGRPVELGQAGPGVTGQILSVGREGAVVGVRHEVLRVITATGDDIYGDGDVSRQALELAADTLPGMSGGGVFDADGALLGIVFAESRERPVTYAVAGAEIEAFLAGVDPVTPVEAGRC